MSIFDSGKFRVSVPDGWMAFCGSDSGGKITPKKVHIYKGIVSEAEMFTHAGITVCFFNERDYYLSPKHFYDNVVDREAFVLGGYTWSAYTCTSLDYPYTMLDAKRDGHIFQVMILMKNREHEISLDDADVQLIISSLAPIK